MVTGLEFVYCDILAKDVAAFCPCLIKNLPEAKFKSNDLISLVEDISRQPNIDSVTQVQVIILEQIFNEKEQQGG